METESKYLKKIRDVLRKKNSGSSSGTIYSGPNTKAKYLNDIAKEVDKLDISGGGSSYESPLFIIHLNITPSGTTIRETVTQVEDAIRNGKIVYLQVDNKLIPLVTSAGTDLFVFISKDITTDIFPGTTSEDDNAITIEYDRYWVFRQDPHEGAVEHTPFTKYCKVEEIVTVYSN